MVPEVEDSVAVGLRVDGDVEVVLFVKLAPVEESASTASGDGGRRPKVRVTWREEGAGRDGG